MKQIGKRSSLNDVYSKEKVGGEKRLSVPNNVISLKELAME